MIKAYKVSSSLDNNNEPCGCLYYFRNIDNAVKALLEFDTAIVSMYVNEGTTFSDDWYE